MTTDNDIVNRLRALSRGEHSDLSVGDEAAAEIVRLRGEVEGMRHEAVEAPAEAFDPSIHPIPGEGQQPAAPSEAVNVIGMPEFDGLLDYIYEYGTEAEGVIERASAFARAVIARYAPQQPAMLNGVEEARVLVAQAPDRRPRPAAPRGLQVSRACQSYVERSGICADGFIQTRHCRGDFAGCPMCKAPTQTVPNCQLEDVERNPHFNEDGSPRYYKPQGGA